MRGNRCPLLYGTPVAGAARCQPSAPWAGRRPTGARERDLEGARLRKQTIALVAAEPVVGSPIPAHRLDQFDERVLAALRTGWAAGHRPAVDEAMRRSDDVEVHTPTKRRSRPIRTRRVDRWFDAVCCMVRFAEAGSMRQLWLAVALGACLSVLAIGFRSATAQRTDGLQPPAFEVDRGWPTIPNGWILGEVSSVAVDGRDHIWII